MNRSITRYLTGIFILICCVSGKVDAQYCVPSYSIGCTSTGDIDRSGLTGAFSTSITDPATGCSSTAYDNLIGSIPPVSLQQGATYHGAITTDFFSNEDVRIWID